MKSVQPLTQAPMRRTSLVTVTERWTHAKQSKVELACTHLNVELALVTIKNCLNLLHDDSKKLWLINYKKCKFTRLYNNK